MEARSLTELWVEQKAELNGRGRSELWKEGRGLTPSQASAQYAGQG